jgi:transposase-like protein
MRKDISTEEIVRLYSEEKAGRRAIAKRLGVSVELVRGRLERRAYVQGPLAREGTYHKYAGWKWNSNRPSNAARSLVLGL